MKIARMNLPGRAVPVQLNGLGDSILTEELARFLVINMPFASLNELTTGLVSCVQNSGHYYKLVVEKRRIELVFGNPEKESTILIEEEEDNACVHERYRVTVTSNQPNAKKSKIPDGWKNLDDETQEVTTDPFLKLKNDVKALSDSPSSLTRAVTGAWDVVISSEQSDVIKEIIALDLPACLSTDNNTFIKCSVSDGATYHLIYEKTHGFFIAIYGHEFTASNQGFGSGHVFYWTMIEDTLKREVEYDKDVLDPTCILIKVERESCYPVIAVLNENQINFTKTQFPQDQVSLIQSEISELESALSANEINLVIKGETIKTLRERTGEISF